MIPESELNQARSFLEKAQNPVFVYDKDTDGLCAYVLARKFCKMKGSGLALQTSPKLDVDSLDSVLELNPDLLVVLDVPIISQDFINRISVPILWFDHHPLVERTKVHYLNPRKWNAESTHPTTYLVWKVTQGDLWIATVGSLSDWFIPDFLAQFKKKYPSFLKREKDPGKILFKTPFGELVKVISFIQKGKPNEVKKLINLFFKIEDPKEIVEQTSESGTLIWQHAQHLKKEFDALLASAKERGKKKMLVFIYDSKTSFTKELSNELSFLYPKKFIIVGREKGDSLKMSMRASFIKIPQVLEKALVNVRGYGGGHDYACGGSVMKEDFERFVQNIEEQL